MEVLGPFLAASGIIGLFGAAATLVIQLFRENGRIRTERQEEIRDLRHDVTALKTENFACRMQVNGLLSLLQKQGISVPDWLFRRSEVPDAE